MSSTGISNHKLTGSAMNPDMIVPDPKDNNKSQMFEPIKAPMEISIAFWRKDAMVAIREMEAERSS